MIKRILMALTIIAAGFVMMVSTTPALAANDASKEAACTAIGGTYSGGVCNDGSSGSAEPQDVINKIITIFSWVVGAIAVIMLIFGGLKYVTSGGDSSKITSAKNTLVFALIGLVIVALAQVIVIFVLQRANNATKQAATVLTVR